MAAKTVKRPQAATQPPELAPPEAFRDRIRELRRVPASELRANPGNWRRHPEGQLRALRGMLEQIGFAGAALAYEGPDGLTLIDGHARQELAADEEIPVLVLDLDEAEAKLLLATFDPLGAMAGTDSEALAALLAEVSVDQADLEAHLVTFLAGGRKAGKTDVDDLPEVAATRSSPGALWALGEHRVLCADATDPTAWERLMAAATADILWTDPPYGVGYQSKLSIDEAVARNRRRDGLDIVNDQLEGPAFRAFLADALGHALSWMRPGAAVYVSVPTGPPMEDFMAVLNGADVFRQTLIWVKDVFVMGRHDYHYRHEGILYGWKPGAAHAFTGGRSQDTVWDVPRPKRSKEHPTMKPVELIAPALENSSLPGALVLDPFLGSGSTLIAAEHTERLCYGMDVDPRYVDVALARWEAFTGQEAVRLDG